MLGYVTSFMILAGFICCVINGTASQSLTFLLEGCSSSVELMLSLLGSYLLWLGIMNIVKKSGLIDKIATLFKKPLMALMPNVGNAITPITLNLAANFFGLGNAATPFGIEAMKELANNSPYGSNSHIASDDMCMFLALNASAIELLPTTVISMRTVCGSVNPTSVVLPTFISSLVSAVTAILICRAFSGKKNGNG